MLTEWGWEVYQEVARYGCVCDIVAKRDKVLWAIEVKRSLGLAVIEQAYRWISSAHYVSVLVPSSRNRFGQTVCSEFGIGVLLLLKSGEIVEQVRPKMNRKACLFDLHEEQKTFCQAGSNNRGHWTPFKRTVRSLVSKVENNPGIEFNELVKVIDHHYSSLATAKSCLRGYIGGVIPELRVEIVNKRLCVFPADTERVRSI